MNKEVTPALIERVADRLKALGDPWRIRILMRLREGPCNVSALSDALGAAQPSVSKHLALLKQVGLVASRREGTQSIYSVRDASVFDLCEVVCAGVVRHLKEEHAALGLTPANGKGDETR
ncbi:MAG: metalloregulator ArsR/SmtB family transcription factor [Planctomycetota bacterium]|nr:metalloregulator ArsR/SmtB family transcription factor [Planctomycetota bacterium]